MDQKLDKLATQLAEQHIKLSETLKLQDGQLKELTKSLKHANQHVDKLQHKVNELSDALVLRDAQLQSLRETLTEADLPTLRKTVDSLSKQVTKDSEDSAKLVIKVGLQLRMNSAKDMDVLTTRMDKLEAQLEDVTGSLDEVLSTIIVKHQAEQLGCCEGCGCSICMEVDEAAVAGVADSQVPVPQADRHS